MEIDSLRIRKFCELTGWPEEAIRTRISNGDWTDGLEYTRINRVLLISIEGYELWVSKNRAQVPDCLK